MYPYAWTRASVNALRTVAQTHLYTCLCALQFCALMHSGSRSVANTTCCAPDPTDCMFEVLSPSSVPARDHRVQEARHACTVFSFELYVPVCKGNDPSASPRECPERQRPIASTQPGWLESHTYTHMPSSSFFYLIHHRRMQYRHAIVCKNVCALWYVYA